MCAAVILNITDFSFTNQKQMRSYPTEAFRDTRFSFGEIQIVP